METSLNHMDLFTFAKDNLSESEKQAIGMISISDFYYLVYFGKPLTMRLKEFKETLYPGLDVNAAWGVINKMKKLLNVP